MIITQDMIKERVIEIAKEIYTFYNELQIDDIYVIFLLNGSFIFAADLLRELSNYKLKMCVTSLKISSYIGTLSEEGKLKITGLSHLKCSNKYVLVIDDILDTGQTLKYTIKIIKKTFAPKLVKVCVLLNKQKADLDELKFVGFTIPDGFVIGYGLDYDGFYRELPYIIDLDSFRTFYG